MRLSLFFLAVSAALAQSALKFEVASIKPSSAAELEAIKRGGRSSLFPEQGISISGRRVTVLGLTTKTLIRAAYSLRADQLSGEPDWTNTQFYDIVASGEAGTALSFPAARQMLQTLLADRFQLKFRRETKDGLAYALIIGKSGQKLKTSVAPEYSTHVTVGSSQIQMAVSKASIVQLCARLSTFVGRPVVDKTGLAGAYDLRLSFAPEALEGPLSSEPREDSSIFTALADQLGLKLEATKAPVETLIIDQVQRPSAN